MSAGKDYFRMVLDTLGGQSVGGVRIPPEKLDWEGPSAFLALFDGTTGPDRVEMVRAIGRAIREHPAPLGVVAQLVEIASALDLAEVVPDVQALSADPVAMQEPLHSAVNNFLAYKGLPRAVPLVAGPSPAELVRTRNAIGRR
jgi:hypothetical protein